MNIYIRRRRKLRRDTKSEKKRQAQDEKKKVKGQLYIGQDVMRRKVEKRFGNKFLFSDSFNCSDKRIQFFFQTHSVARIQQVDVSQHCVNINMLSNRHKSVRVLVFRNESKKEKGGTKEENKQAEFKHLITRKMIVRRLRLQSSSNSKGRKE